MKTKPIFMNRTRNIFRHQKERAAEESQTLNYHLGSLRSLIEPTIDKPCPYCGDTITFKTFSADHAQPTSRGGPHALANIIVCCKRCNSAKGDMTEAEYRQLLSTLAQFPQQQRRNIIARLAMGGKAIYN